MQFLSPRSARSQLRSQGIPPLSEDDLSLILEFCLLDAMKSHLTGQTRSGVYADLHSIAFWPSVNGDRCVSGTAILLLPRDDLEMQLFAKSRANVTLEVSKLRPRVRELLLQDIAYPKGVLRFRDLDDLSTD